MNASAGTIRVSNADGIATVTIDHGARKNALTRLMARELAVLWDQLAEDPAVAVIVLTGAGQDFCAGADFSDPANLPEDEAGEAPRGQPVNWVTRAARRHVMGIMDCEKPVIAKVRGAAYGMGASMALACDMVFAGSSARFCDSHVKMGLAAGDGGVLLWPLAIGIHRAKEYLMTGAPVSAAVAASIGLITRCLPDEELDPHVQAFAERLLDLPPHAVNYTKMALNLAIKQMTGAAFEASLAYELYTMKMGDSKEAVEAFLEKRPGIFKGR